MRSIKKQNRSKRKNKEERKKKGWQGEEDEMKEKTNIENVKGKGGAKEGRNKREKKAMFGLCTFINSCMIHLQPYHILWGLGSFTDAISAAAVSNRNIKTLVLFL